MTDNIIQEAARVIAVEGEAVTALAKQLDDGFRAAVELILRAPGRVILTGIGKSGIIAQKIAATLSSTGTPAYFLHPAEGMHGDLGLLRPGDVVVAVSYSGETPEILCLLPPVAALGVTLIAMTGNARSTLARAAAAVITTTVDKEACPLGLVPTASTTAALVMGDALAVCVMKERGFGGEDFAAVHPGGTLGRRLRAKVAELWHAGDEVPAVPATATFAAAVAEINAKRFGITGVVDGEGRLVGVITDGDVRRAYTRGIPPAETKAEDVMSRSPKTVGAGATAAEALHLMETFQITALFVTDDAGRPLALVHIHDVLGRGAATQDIA